MLARFGRVTLPPPGRVTSSAGARRIRTFWPLEHNSVRRPAWATRTSSREAQRGRHLSRRSPASRYRERADGRGAGERPPPWLRNAGVGNRQRPGPPRACLVSLGAANRRHPQQHAHDRGPSCAHGGPPIPSAPITSRSVVHPAWRPYRRRVTIDGVRGRRSAVDLARVRAPWRRPRLDGAKLIVDGRPGAPHSSRSGRHVRSSKMDRGPVSGGPHVHRHRRWRPMRGLAALYRETVRVAAGSSWTN